MKKKKLRRLIRQLEAETELRMAVVMALVHKVRPTNGFRLNYLVYALNHNFTAKEFYGIEQFWHRACMRFDSANPPSRQEVLVEFDEMIPSRAGTLDEILQADRADGPNGVFHLLSTIVLGHETSNTQPVDEVPKHGRSDQQGN